MEWIFTMDIRLSVVWSCKFGGKYGFIGGEVQDIALILLIEYVYNRVGWGKVI